MSKQCLNIFNPDMLCFRCKFSVVLLTGVLTDLVASEIAPDSAALKFIRSAESSGWVEDRKAHADEKVELTFGVKQTHLTELQKMIDRVSDPRSPDYGHYLTKEQVDELTAPRPESIAVVENSLHGIPFKETAKGATISAAVTVEAAQKLLGGTFVYFCEANKVNIRTCTLRNPTAQVPEALAQACDTISPLRDPLPAINGTPLPGPILDSLTYQEDSAIQLSSRMKPSFTTPLEPGPVILPNEKLPGCCYSIGYGSKMKPCCLKVTQARSADDCGRDPGSTGGATAFNATSCPHGVEQAAEWIAAEHHMTNRTAPQTLQHPLLTTSLSSSPVTRSKGCCFSIGYGAGMKPCCLKTREANDAADCGSDRDILGGTKNFNATCPSNANTAALWIDARSGRSGAAEDSKSVSADGESSAIGCCYSIGFGALMKPCCLQTTRVVSSQCKAGQQLMGGAKGFSTKSCPQNAREAADWLQQNPNVKRPSGESLEQEAPVPVVEDEAGSSYDFAFTCGIICFSVVLLGGATVYSRNLRTGRGMPLLVGAIE